MVDGNIMNLEAVGDSVRRGWKRMGSRIKNLAMALPSAQVITKKITVPAGLREDELETQVETGGQPVHPVRAGGSEPRFPDPRAGAQQPRGRGSADRGLAQGEGRGPRGGRPKSAGLKAIVMDIDAFAAQTAFELMETQLPDGGRDQVIALVDVGASMMNINVLRNNQSVYMREQPLRRQPAHAGNPAPLQPVAGRG